MNQNGIIKGVKMSDDNTIKEYKEDLLKQFDRLHDEVLINSISSLNKPFIYKNKAYQIEIILRRLPVMDRLTDEERGL